MSINRDSIAIKIASIFIVSFSLILFFFYYYSYNQKQIEIFKAKDRHIKTIYSAMWLMHRHNQSVEEINRFFADFGLSAVMDKKKRLEIISESKKWFEIESKKAVVNVYENNGELYISIKGRYLDMLYRDDAFKKGMNGNLLLLLIGATLVLILTYFWVIKSLYPLKILQEKIRRFADGDMEIESRSEKKDEIAEVANEFDRAVKKINSLLRSRRFFLRSIMHELKTPITKGRITIEMIENGKQKDRLENLFLRLESLISEFATIEQFESKNYKIRLEKLKISELLSSAIERLMLEDSQKSEIEICCEDINLEVDREFFILALKNLLDNAIKYKKGGVVKIECSSNSIDIITDGEKIEGDIDDYFTPFYKRDIKSNNQMGLGLYIIKNILDEHNFRLEYRHNGEKNIFSIKS